MVDWMNPGAGALAGREAGRIDRQAEIDVLVEEIEVLEHEERRLKAIVEKLHGTIAALFHSLPQVLGEHTFAAFRAWHLSPPVGEDWSHDDQQELLALLENHLDPLREAAEKAKETT